MESRGISVLTYRELAAGYAISQTCDSSDIA